MGDFIIYIADTGECGRYSQANEISNIVPQN